jgi:phage terminase large subunit
LGGWLDKSEGAVFTNWKLGKFEEVGQSIYGQDYGFSVDPTTLVQTSIDKTNKKIYVKELLYQTKPTTTDIATINKRFCDNSLIVADMQSLD